MTPDRLCVFTLLREASAASAASDAGSGSTSETLPRRKTTDGRRASRWGVSQADVAATSVAGVETENNDAPTAADAENALLVRAKFRSILQRVHQTMFVSCVWLRWTNSQFTHDRLYLPNASTSLWRFGIAPQRVKGFVGRAATKLFCGCAWR